MDAWSNDDTMGGSGAAPMGAVARSGMAAFVKSESSTGGTNNGKIVSKIEVVQSKREQKRAADMTLMPPPPPALRPPPPATSSSAPTAANGPPPYRGPAWATEPPPGMVLEIVKDGAIIEEIPLNKGATLFGRNLHADVPLDHPSISRQHAAVCFQGMTGKFMVLDLGSTHRTFLNGRPLTKDSPAELPEGAELRFGASSRAYRLRSGCTTLPNGAAASASALAIASSTAPTSSAATLPHAQTASQQQQRQHSDALQELMPPRGLPKRPGDAARTEGAVGDGAAGDAPARRVSFAGGQAGKGLERVIGYSDSRDFVAGVGPKPGGEEGGRFANLISSSTASAADPKPKGQERHPSKLNEGGTLREGVKPELHTFLEELKRRPPRTEAFGGGGGLYDAMPPAGG